MRSEMDASNTFHQQWYEQMREFWIDKILENKMFTTMLSRFDASAVPCVAISPFSTPPRGRYFCKKYQKMAAYDALFNMNMAILPLGDYKKKLDFAPGCGIWSTLLDDVPAGFIKPLTIAELKDEKVILSEEVVNFMNLEEAWIGFKQLDACGVYALPLFIGVIPVYVLLIMYRPDRDHIRESLDLSVAISMMQAMQRCFSSIFTPEEFELIIKKCVHNSKLCDPSFTSLEFLEAAESYRWRSWYQCIPGMALADLPDVNLAMKDIKERWERADSIDPAQLWETVASQFSAQGFFIGDCHEGWQGLKHNGMREQISTCLTNMAQTFRRETHQNLETRMASGFLERTTEWLAKAEDQHSFNRLKALFCKTMEDMELPRIRGLTLRSCVEICLKSSANEWIFRELSLFYDQSYAIDLDPDLQGDSAWEFCWEFCLILSILAPCIGIITIDWAKPLGYQSLSIELAETYIGRGSSTARLTKILNKWGACLLVGGKGETILPKKGNVLTIRLQENKGDIDITAQIEEHGS